MNSSTGTKIFLVVIASIMVLSMVVLPQLILPAQPKVMQPKVVMLGKRIDICDYRGEAINEPMIDFEKSLNLEGATFEITGGHIYESTLFINRDNGNLMGYVSSKEYTSGQDKIPLRMLAYNEAGYSISAQFAINILQDKCITDVDLPLRIE